MNFLKRTSLFSLIALVLVANSGAKPSGDLPPAVVPIAQDADWTLDWWMPRHEEKLAEAKQRGKDVRLLFIGDSITHHWDKGVWADNFEKYGAFNLGFGGDRTEHVLWRLENGALENLSPEVTVIMIGTNNTGQGDGYPAAETLSGIEKIITEVQKQIPDTKIILHSIFPRGSEKTDRLRVVNDEINQELPSLAEQKGVRLLDLNKMFLLSDGVLPRSIMPDLLHPKKAGYQLWADGLNPVLQEYFAASKAAIEHEIIDLWPTGIPQPHDESLETKIVRKWNKDMITDVSDPSITLYALKGHRPTGFVLVCPGGAYEVLSWENEGSEIAEWLNSIGYSAGILKYRTPDNREGALQDAQRAIGYVRSKAEEWNIDPHKIGILGFSAGGHLSATLSNRWQKRAYPKVDAADEVSCRPDFAGLVYPAYLGDEELNMIGDFEVTKETPSTFIIQAQNDSNYIASAFAYSSALHLAGVASELHIFPSGGHGFGLRPSAYAASNWPDLFEIWLLDQ